MTESLNAKALTTASTQIAEALNQARLAYQFGANAYTYATLEGCFKAAKAFDQHISELAFAHSAEWLRKFPKIVEDRNAE